MLLKYFYKLKIPRQLGGFECKIVLIKLVALVYIHKLQLGAGKYLPLDKEVDKKPSTSIHGGRYTHQPLYKEVDTLINLYTRR